MALEIPTETREQQQEKYYRNQAKELTHLLFDKRFLADDLSLASIEWLEDYLAFILKSQCDMAAKGALLLKSLRDRR